MNCGQTLFKILNNHSYAYSISQVSQKIVSFLNTNMGICWHPEQEFPYEFSKSLPIKKENNLSLLKIGNREIKEMFENVNNDLIPHDLAAKTYTTKHTWYPRARDKKFNRRTSMDRRYL